MESGKRWDQAEKKFAITEEWKEEDDKDPETSISRTSRELGKAMNSVFPNIKFTTETTEDYDNLMLPTLDFTMRLEDGYIVYSYYEKEVSSKFCLLEIGAMSENTKNATLSQDLIRRMLNTSERTKQEERNQVVEKYIL